MLLFADSFPLFFLCFQSAGLGSVSDIDDLASTFAKVSFLDFDEQQVYLWFYHRKFLFNIQVLVCHVFYFLSFLFSPLIY